MSELTKSKYWDNEIAKANDFGYAEDREIENISSIFEQLAKSTNDLIVYGLQVQERATPSMNVDIKAGLGFRVAGAEAVYNGSLMGPIAITNGGAQNRIDTLEIRAKETDFDNQQRAFKDPGTGNLTYNDVETKTRYEIEAQVIQGTEGAGVAPNHTAGWMKVAEIHVDAGESTAIYNADIENVSAGKDGEANSAWTAETTATFRLKSLSEIKSLFRTKHKEDGDHVNDVIQGQHIDFGTGANQVDADLMPLGTDITHAPTGGTPANLTASSLVRPSVQKILDLLIDLSGVQNDAVINRHIGPAAVRQTEIDLGIDAGDVDADVLPLGTAVTSNPTGGTATNLANTSFVRAALQEIFNRLKDLSGVQNDAVDERHVNFGTEAGQVDADLMPLGTAITHAPTGGTAAGLTASSTVRYAVQRILDLLINLSGVQNGAVLSRHIGNDQVNSQHYVADSIDAEHINWGTASGQIGLLKGHMAIALTEWDTSTQPQIAAGGSCEINGGLYTNPSAVTITGTTVNGTWYDILLTPSGTTYTASFVARQTGVWSDSKQGLYSGGNRVVACVFRDGSGNFINKNILNINNRIVCIKFEIGNWNMDVSNFANVAHGINYKKIRHVHAIVRNDTDTDYWNLEATNNLGQTQGGLSAIDSLDIQLRRVDGGVFDSTDYDSTSYNRGWITIGYEV